MALKNYIYNTYLPLILQEMYYGCNTIFQTNKIIYRFYKCTIKYVSQTKMSSSISSKI